MIIIFKYGLTYKGVEYGWYQKHLYRLPQTIGLRTYPLKKLTLTEVGNHEGYRLSEDRKTIAQLEVLSHPIDFTYNKIENEHTPF